jgi:hypothetical protein
MLRYLFAVVMIVFSSTLCAQTDTTVYYMVSQGDIKGVQKVWKADANDYRYSYKYNDRGRGDSIETTLLTNNAGNIIRVNTTGVDYYKNPYAEEYVAHDDSASWKINGERTSKKFSGQFYNVNDGGPAMMELLVKWLQQQPGNKTAILPDGYAHIQQPLMKNIFFNGKELQLKLFSVYFDPSPLPNYFWFTNDMKFFASAASWGSFVLKGYESLADSLFTLQELASQNYYEQQLDDNSVQLPQTLRFIHANVFQSSTATVQQDMTVDVVNGKIKALYPSSSKNASKADTVIDCKGKFLMPGLWDMHAHFGKEEGVMYLAGVTHIRDMGNAKILLTYKEQIASNKLMGPDVSYISGFIDKKDPYQGPTGAIIASLDEGLKAVDEYHALGYQQIKLYSAVKPEWVAPLAERAHSYGMRVCGHIPAFMTAEQAINAGYNEVTHMNFIFLNFMGDTIDTRTPARFRLVGDNAGSLDLQSKQVHDFIAFMKSKHISLDPTMNVWQGMFDEFKGDTSNFMKPVVSWLPESWLGNLAIQTPFGNDAQEVSYKAAFSNMMRMLKLLYDNGILLVAGTDGGEAIALHHELELYTQAGIPANEVLKIATYNAALDCNLQDKYGQVLPGRDADLILIDGDPAKDISTVRRVAVVIKNGRIYNPKQLLQTQGWKYYY